MVNARRMLLTRSIKLETIFVMGREHVQARESVKDTTDHR